MTIAVVGLGLIGGSIAKAVKARTGHTVLGIDTNTETVNAAVACGAVDRAVTAEEIIEADICFICLYPVQTVKFIRENLGNFKKGGIVTDVCGVKKFICENAEQPLREAGVYYIGGHPMAGKEKSGFAASEGSLLCGASYIITKTPDTDSGALALLCGLIAELGCNIIFSAPDEHDRVIAYTSQLAHIVSSSYVKSPAIQMERGFTGGSFQDMTRVALLEENMWTDLFMLNKDNLLKEIDILMANLQNYRDGIYNNDCRRISELLKEGKEIKKKHLK